MSFVFTNALRAFAEGEIDLANDDIRASLLMTNTTFDVDEDITQNDATTTEDYYDHGSHPAAGATLLSEAVNVDNALDRAEFDAADLVFAGLGVGSRQAQALLIFKFITDIGSSLPIAYIDTGGFPFDGNGGDVTFQWNAEGIIQFT